MTFGFQPSPRTLWGAKAIARFLNLTERQVMRLASVPGCPIYRPPGAGYWARPDELDAWLRTKPMQQDG